MSPEMIGILGIALLFILLLCRMWVGAALGLVGFIGIFVMRGFDQGISVLGGAPFVNITTYTITVLPMFTLMGMIISESNIGRNLFKVGYNWIGARPGGLASATVVSSGMLGAICGSHMVGTVIMSKIALPEMKRYRYDDGFAAATIAAGAPLSIIIPPSMPLILYGILTEQNIGQLFMSGLLPGVLMVLVFIAIITVSCSRDKTLGPRGETVPMNEKIRSLVGILPVVILFLLVLGGIYMGIFTTTESGALGAIFAAVIAVLTKSFGGKKIWIALKETALTVCMMLFLLAGTYIFIGFITLSKLPFMLSNLIVNMNANHFVLVFAVAALYIVLGMILPEITMVALTVPILYPALMAVGFDPIWLGIFITLMMALGAITPPIGLIVFIVSGLSGVPILRVFKSCMPFIIGDLVVIACVAAFPALATFIPSMMVAH
jgi:tripartite ATP-independent transporter DctM subunit